ncbi:vacuolar sorting protein VPS33/slp1 [Clydaea vesicula]|uniref:Vacuolar sorting protein VPS33/slp1 n=1 Tax=Clydaea vesicula TaxID=447962 RepID=A0AAD5TZH6_9FUNG|nr:vacuolar sorting protein VPS33/slp1 [Clydaea vesicula]
MSARPPKYAVAYIFTLSALSDALFSQLSKIPQDLILSFFEVNLDLIAFESQVFLMSVNSNSPTIDRILYASQSQRDYIFYLENVSTHLISLLATFEDFPIIRYYNPKGNHSSLSANVAFHLNKQLMEMSPEEKVYYKKSDPFGNQTKLFILDRSVDMVSPFLHEYGYQSMVNDRFSVEVNKITYQNIDDDSSYHVSVVDEKDPFWAEHRHKPSFTAAVLVEGALKQFIEENPDFDKNSKTSEQISELSKKVWGLQEYTEKKERLTGHVNILRALTAIGIQHKLKDIADFEQDIANGEDDEGNPVDQSKIDEDFHRLLKDVGILVEDKLRIFLIYVLCSKQQPSEESLFSLWEESCGMTAIEETLTSLKQRLNGLRCFDLDYFNGFQELMDELFENLDYQIFPCVNNEDLNEEDSNNNIGDAMKSGTQGGAGLKYKFKSFKPTWGTKRLVGSFHGDEDFRKNGARIILFFLGGVSFPEIRSCYKLSKKHNRQIYIGSTHIITPRYFLEELSEYKTKANNLPIPRPRPVNFTPKKKVVSKSYEDVSLPPLVLEISKQSSPSHSTPNLNFNKAEVAVSDIQLDNEEDAAPLIFQPRTSSKFASTESNSSSPVIKSPELNYPSSSLDSLVSSENNKVLSSGSLDVTGTPLSPLSSALQSPPPENETRDSRESKDSRDSRESRDSRDFKDSKDCKSQQSEGNVSSLRNSSRERNSISNSNKNNYSGLGNKFSSSTPPPSSKIGADFRKPAEVQTFANSSKYKKDTEPPVAIPILKKRNHQDDDSSFSSPHPEDLVLTSPQPTNFHNVNIKVESSSPPKPSPQNFDFNAKTENFSKSPNSESLATHHQPSHGTAFPSHIHRTSSPVDIQSNNAPSYQRPLSPSTQVPTSKVQQSPSVSPNHHGNTQGNGSIQSSPVYSNASAPIPMPSSNNSSNIYSSNVSHRPGSSPISSNFSGNIRIYQSSSPQNSGITSNLPPRSFIPNSSQPVNQYYRPSAQPSQQQPPVSSHYQPPQVPTRISSSMNAYAHPAFVKRPVTSQNAAFVGNSSGAIPVPNRPVNPSRPSGQPYQPQVIITQRPAYNSPQQQQFGNPIYNPPPNSSQQQFIPHRQFVQHPPQPNQAHGSPQIQQQFRPVNSQQSPNYQNPPYQQNQHRG